jgi:hypothetical protein
MGMGTSISADGAHRHSKGTTEGGRYAADKLAEATSTTGKARGGFAMIAAAATMDDVDIAMSKVVAVTERLGELQANPDYLETDDGQKELSTLSDELAQTYWDVNEAVHLAGLTEYEEKGLDGAEQALMDLQYRVPVDASAVSMIAFAAMDDEDFAVSAITRGGDHLVNMMSERSIHMLLEHESEFVRSTAVLAGAAHRKQPLTAAYIAKHPEPSTIEAVNMRQERKGLPDRFSVENGIVLTKSPAGTAAYRIADLIREYDQAQLPPCNRLAA